MPKVLVVMLVGFFPIVVSTTEGFLRADREMVDLVRSMGANRLQVLRYVLIPSATPAFFAGLKIAAWGGTLLMAFMYLAALPIGAANQGFTNPITDSHWIEAAVLLVAAYTLAGDTWGLGRWWGEKVGNSWLR